MKSEVTVSEICVGMLIGQQGAQSLAVVFGCMQITTPTPIPPQLAPYPRSVLVVTDDALTF